MTQFPDWLPALVCLEDYGGSWGKYIEAVYSYFKADFIDTDRTFENKIIRIMRYPLLHGKEATFWHITSEGEAEEERTPDIRRCERIRWPWPMIENYCEEVIKCWRSERRWKRKKGVRISKRATFWLCDQDYVVVLAEDKNYMTIVTAYYVTNPHTRRKLQAEYEKCGE